MQKIFFDGAADPNPGKASFGFCHIINDEEVSFSCGYIGITTNNVAEYTGLLKALEYCKLHEIRNVDIYGDSLLVVNQMNGKWKTKSENLALYHQLCKKLMHTLDCRIHWIRREENQRADTLSKMPLTQFH